MLATLAAMLDGSGKTPGDFLPWYHGREMTDAEIMLNLGAPASIALKD